MKDRYRSSFPLALIVLLAFVVGHSGWSIGDVKTPRVATICAAPIFLATQPPDRGQWGARERYRDP